MSIVLLIVIVAYLVRAIYKETPACAGGGSVEEQSQPWSLFEQFRHEGVSVPEALGTSGISESSTTAHKRGKKWLREYVEPLFGEDVRNGIGEIRSSVRTELAEINELRRDFVQTYIDPFREEDVIEDTVRGLREDVSELLSTADERYQQFVQLHIDPILGASRHAELQGQLTEEPSALTPAERYANRRLGMGASALGLSLLGTWVFAPLTPLAIAVGIAASGAKYPLAYRQWKENKRIGAIHLICVYSLYLWLGGYATVGSLGAFLYGLMLKARAVGEDRSRNNLISIFQLQPEKVWLRVDGGESEMPFDQVKVGDILVIRAGQTIPVDGCVADGVATVDQHMLTGEAQPAEKKAGDEVLAATLVISGAIDVRVVKTSEETTAGKIAEALNTALKNAKPVSVSAVEVADKLAMPTLAASALSWPLVGTAGAVSLMGANTTTASYLSGSLAMLNFLNIAARQGVLVKDAQALERLSAVDTFVFDKTGTLTLEQPDVSRVHALNGLPAEEVLRLAAAAETRQSHPIARAILDEARTAGLDLPDIDQAHYELGYGLKVRLRERLPYNGPNAPVIRVGSGRFMAMEGVAVARQASALADDCHAKGHSLVMVAVDDELAGCIELQPSLRPEARDVLSALRERGHGVYILSGDHETPTRKLAEELGMTGYFANTLPEAKSGVIAKLQAEGRRVCFVGDGINDALAMRQSDVSISLLGATTVATDTAKIVLMEGSLRQLPELLRLSDEFARNLQRNIWFTSGVSIVAVSGILLGGFTFVATEVLYSVALFGGLGIAMMPLIQRQARSMQLSGPGGSAGERSEANEGV